MSKRNVTDINDFLLYSNSRRRVTLDTTPSITRISGSKDYENSLLYLRQPHSLTKDFSEQLADSEHLVEALYPSSPYVVSFGEHLLTAQAVSYIYNMLLFTRDINLPIRDLYVNYAEHLNTIKKQGLYAPVCNCRNSRISNNWFFALNYPAQEYEKYLAQYKEDARNLAFVGDFSQVEKWDKFVVYKESIDYTPVILVYDSRNPVIDYMNLHFDETDTYKDEINNLLKFLGITYQFPLSKRYKKYKWIEV